MPIIVIYDYIKLYNTVIGKIRLYRLQDESGKHIKQRASMNH